MNYNMCFVHNHLCKQIDVSSFVFSPHGAISNKTLHRWIQKQHRYVLKTKNSRNFRITSIFPRLFQEYTFHYLFCTFWSGHSYNMKPFRGRFGRRTTKINHTDSSDANHNVTMTYVIYWNGIYSLQIIYYFTMSRSRCKFH